MNVRTKTYTVIGITLVIGIVLGLLIARTLVRTPFERLRAMGPRGGLRHIMMQILDPEPDQRKEILTILGKYESLFLKTAVACREKFTRLHTELESELAPVLTATQKNRLKDHIGRLRKGPRWPGHPGEKPPFPPPRGPKDRRPPPRDPDETT